MSRYESSAKIADYEKHSKELLDRMEMLGVEEIETQKLKLDAEALQFEEKEAVEILADSYKRRKRWLNYPIVQKGTNLVISGTHRVLAAKKSDQKTMLCHVVDADQDEIWAIRIEENLTRRRLTKNELRYWMKKARDEWGWTQDLISRIVGLSPGRVSQLLSEKPTKVEEPLEIKESESIQATPESVGMEQYIPQDQGASAGSESGAPPFIDTTLQDRPMTESSIEPEAREFLPLYAGPETWPQGYWTKDEVMKYHGRVNGALQSAFKNLDDPAVRTWVESIYKATKNALGYST